MQINNTQPSPIYDLIEEGTLIRRARRLANQLRANAVQTEDTSVQIRFNHYSPNWLVSTEPNDPEVTIFIYFEGQCHWFDSIEQAERTLLRKEAQEC